MIVCVVFSQGLTSTLVEPVVVTRDGQGAWHAEMVDIEVSDAANEGA